MEFDVVTVFSRLTRKELADSSQFKTVLDQHYEKYKYFYNLIRHTSLSSVNQIYCECPGDNMSLIVVMEFKKKDDSVNFASLINSQLNVKQQNSDYFSVDITRDSNVLNISIENRNISREDEIYEDRFNTN